MLTFLFWNIKGVQGSKPLTAAEDRYKRLTVALAEIVAQENVDVVILAESPFGGALSLAGMKQAETELPPNVLTGVELEIYCRAEKIEMEAIGGAGRATFQRVTLKNSGETLLLAAAHLNSPQRVKDERDREEAVRRLAEEILLAEQSEKHTRALLVGDLNYSPYDPPIWDAKSLHAVPTQILAHEKQRVIKGETYSYFYNPMWAHFAHRHNPAVGGTYYLRTATLNCRFWHIPDQVLLRPALLPFWNDEELSVLTTIGAASLVKSNGIPDAKKYSDHLPLLFRLNL